MPVTIRLATDDDFRAFFGKEPPEVWTAMCGVRDGKVVGIGGVVYSDEGVAVGFLDAKERPSMTLHRAALRFMTVMKDVGEPYIVTYCDAGMSRAKAWLERLGFRKSGETVDSQEVWKWQL